MDSRIVTIGIAAATMVASSLAACAPAPAPAPAPTSTVPAPRYGPECAVAIARARAQPADPFVRPPVAVELFVPEMPTSARDRGRLIVVEVPLDSAGRSDTSGVRVTGTATTEFATKMRRLGQRLRFRPATLEGCGVPGVGRVTFRL